MSKKQRAKNGGLDQYFTRPEIVDKCIEVLRKHTTFDDLFIEPSAGGGNFIKPNMNVVAYDLNPQSEGIISANWFDVKVPENCVVYGNPPFGFAGSLAIKFFNHAANSAKTIAFIVPKSFKKQSIWNRLNLNFWLVEQFDLPKNSFQIPGEELPYDVPCCFQVWKRRETPRIVERQIKSTHIVFCKKQDATHAIRRVGGRAGQLLAGLEHSISSTYFCKIQDGWVLDAIKLMDRNIVNQTAGVRSISKNELVKNIHAFGVENGYML